MKKILVVDWLDKYGGAERVLTELNKQYSFSECYTLINIMSQRDLNKVFQNKNVKIIESNLKFLKSNFRFFFFLSPILFQNLILETKRL